MENKKESSIEWLLSQVGYVPDYIKKCAIRLHQNEIMSAHNCGSLNILESQLEGKKLINSENYYNETYKGGQDE